VIAQAKKPPRLQTLMIRDKPKPQSIENMIATAKAWVRAFDRKG